MPETRKLMRQLRREGFSLSLTEKCHIKITHENMDGWVIISRTSGDWRYEKNMRAEIKRQMRVKALSA